MTILFTIFYLILNTFSNQAYALTNATEDNHWAANEEQIIHAPCNLKQPLSTADILNRLEKIASKYSERQTKTISGTEYKNENRFLLRLVEKLANPASRNEDQLSTWSNSNGCHDVLCSVKENFGEEVGPRLLYLLAKFGFNGSHKLGLNSESLEWKIDELDDVISASEGLPETLLPLKNTNKPLVRRVSFGANILANAVMTFFNLWTTYSSPYRKYTTTHEIGHNIQDEYDVNGTNWNSLSGWQLTEVTNEQGELVKKLIAQNPHTFVSSYAATNPSEDFAETFVAYRFNPEHLLLKSQAKYEALRDKVFFGIEYTNDENCSPAKSKLTTRMREIISSYVNINPNYESPTPIQTWPALLKNRTKTCSSEFVDLLSRDSFPKHLGEFARECLIKQMAVGILNKDTFFSTLKKIPALSDTLLEIIPEEFKNKALEEVSNEFIVSIREGLKLRLAYSQSQLSNELKSGISAQAFCRYYSGFLKQASSGLTRKFVDVFEYPNATANENVINRFGNKICMHAMGGDEAAVAKKITAEDLYQSLDRFITLN